MLRFPVTKVVGSGGGGTIPVLIAAIVMRKPIYLMEQNVLPGRVTLLFSRFAKTIYLSFDESLPYLKSDTIRKRCKVLGNPIRRSFDLDEGGRVLSRMKSPKGPCLLVIGGSQGAQKINECIYSFYSEFQKNGWSIIHITGPTFYAQKGYEGACHFWGDLSESSSILILPYLEQMDKAYTHASIVCSRAGASTISELIAFQKPALLVPYPFAKDDHQTLNADVMAAHNLAKKIDQSDLLGLSFDEFQALLENLKKSHKEESKEDRTLFQRFYHTRELIVTDLLT